MIDIVERLRCVAEQPWRVEGVDWTIFEDAAAEIERLRAYALHERGLGADGLMGELMSARQEIERLREDLAGRDRVCDSYAEENQRFSAEIERLNNGYVIERAARSEAEAEIERLRSDPTRGVHQCGL